MFLYCFMCETDVFRNFASFFVHIVSHYFTYSRLFVNVHRCETLSNSTRFILCKPPCLNNPFHTLQFSSTQIIPAFQTSLLVTPLFIYYRSSSPLSFSNKLTPFIWFLSALQTSLSVTPLFISYRSSSPLSLFNKLIPFIRF